MLGNSQPKGGIGHADRRPQGADRGVRRAAGPGQRTSRAPSSRSSRRPARSSRWSPRRPTTRTGSPRHDFSDGAARPGSELNADQEPAAAEPRDPGDLPAGLDVQAGHRGGGAVQRAVHPRHQGRRAAPASTCRRPRRDLRQRERQRLRRRPDHADPGAGGLLQRRPSATSGSSSATTRCATQAEKFGFDQTYLNDLHGQVAEPVPRRTRTSRRPRCRRSASSTCAATPLQMAMVAAGDRQRRHA